MQKTSALNVNPLLCWVSISTSYYSTRDIHTHKPSLLHYNTHSIVTHFKRLLSGALLRLMVTHLWHLLKHGWLWNWKGKKKAEVHPLLWAFKLYTEQYSLLHNPYIEPPLSFSLITKLVVKTLLVISVKWMKKETEVGRSCTQSINHEKKKKKADHSLLTVMLSGDHRAVETMVWIS